MCPASHQIIRLVAGPHGSPSEGVCVMELASMLAGEPFSDHPACASPVLGAFLRTYNDLVHDRHRQSLYRFAALVVGTRSNDEVEAARGKACAAWVADALADRTHSRWRHWLLAWAARGIDARPPETQASTAGRLGARLAREQGDARHANVEAFLERLVAPPEARASRQPGAREPVVV
jgi:hypothetical protein